MLSEDDSRKLLTLIASAVWRANALKKPTPLIATGVVHEAGSKGVTLFTLVDVESMCGRLNAGEQHFATEIIRNLNIHKRLGSTPLLPAVLTATGELTLLSVSRVSPELASGLADTAILRVYRDLFARKVIEVVEELPAGVKICLRQSKTLKSRASQNKTTDTRTHRDLRKSIERFGGFVLGSRPDLHQYVDNLQFRSSEVKRCVDAKAYLGAIVVAGSIQEGVLIVALELMSDFIHTAEASLSLSSDQVNRLHQALNQIRKTSPKEPNVGQLVSTFRATGLLDDLSAEHSTVLNNARNCVHLTRDVSQESSDKMRSEWIRWHTGLTDFITSFTENLERIISKMDFPPSHVLGCTCLVTGERKPLSGACPQCPYTKGSGFTDERRLTAEEAFKLDPSLRDTYNELGDDDETSAH